MRILILTHGKEKSPTTAIMRWDRLPAYFEKKHEVKRVLKGNWASFYYHYLKFNPDVVISVGIIGFLPALLKKLGLIRKPIVHDWTDQYTEVMGKKYGIDRIAFLEYFIIKNTPNISTPSKALVRKCELFGKTAEYIPHGIDTEAFRAEPIELEGKLKAVYVGSLNQYKQTQKIIDAAAGLPCEMYLVGKSDKELTSLPKNVHHIGAVPSRDVPRYLKAADILIHTPNDDSTLKIYEYIAAKKPIVALNGRIAYLLRHKEEAYLTDDLREGLKELVTNNSLRGALQKNVSRIKTYSWNEIGDKYLEYINRVVEKK
ncbi:Glycosyl transferases group 1 [uncultured archaeon]|nr:Glycosyl transferases group 1 [uncultured archaeon]